MTEIPDNQKQYKHLIKVNSFKKINGKAIPLWKHDKILSELSEKELKEVTERTIYPNEIVLDNDNENETMNIIEKLKKDNLNFLLYFHHKKQISKNHIHLFFEDLPKFNQEKRHKIRKIFIEYYKCDLQKFSENMKITMEGKKHRNTGIIKKLYPLEGIDYSHKGLNKRLPDWVFYKYEQQEYE